MFLKSYYPRISIRGPPFFSRYGRVITTEPIFGSFGDLIHDIHHKIL